MTISMTKNTWESICDLFSSIEIKESSIEIKESSIEIKRSFSIHLETVVRAPFLSRSAAEPVPLGSSNFFCRYVRGDIYSFVQKSFC